MFLLFTVEIINTCPYLGLAVLQLCRRRCQYIIIDVYVNCIYFNPATHLVCRADVTARDNFKWTALHHACHSGQEDLVLLLLENGAEMDAQTINGGTPLMRAIESSREAVVELLISRGYVWVLY